MLLHGLLAASTLGIAPSEPRATEALELRWQAPAGCPARDEVRDAIARLGPSPGGGLVVTAEIEAVHEGFLGTLALGHDETTVRRLQAEDCSLLARAMAVVIAVSFDPIAVAEAATVPAPAPEPEIPPNVDARPPTRPHGARPLDRSPARTTPQLEPPDGGMELGARLGAGVGGLLLPAAGVGLSLAPFIGTARLHVRAVAQYWAPQRIAFDPRRDASGVVQLVSGGVRVCPQLAWAHVRVPLCAGADVGAMLGRGTGRDLATSSSGRQPWVGAVLEPGISVGVTSHVSLWLALEGVISLYRPRFAIDGGPEPWTAGAGAVRGLVGVQVHRASPRRRSSQKP